MRFKKGNRWKSSKGQLRYKTWRKNVFELTRKERQQEYYMLITYIVGTSFPKRDMTKVME